MKIIDAHAHIGKSVSDGAEATEKTILDGMNQAGIEKTVIFAIDSHNPGGTYKEANDHIIDIVSRNRTRFIGLARIQPKTGKKAVDEVLRCKDAGLNGIKLHSRTEGFFPKDCEAVLEAANNLNLPVMIHIENIKEKEPDDWRPYFQRYNACTYIIAHAAKSSFRQAGRIAKEFGNVMLDTSVISYHRTRVLLDIAGADNILFASDYPYSHPLLELKKYELLVRDAEDLEKIFFKNAERIWPCNE